MNSSRFLAFISGALLSASPAFAQVSISPLLTFGGGDGWLAPGENPFLTTASTERGMGYNGSTGHVLLVSRSGGISVRILDGASGTELGTLDVTGIAGGTFALNKIAVGGDGAIYGANLRTGATDTNTYKIYRWDNEFAAPVVIFDNLALGNNTRVGDDFDVIGSGAATRIAAGYNVSGTAVVPGTNGFAIIDPTASAATPTTPVFDSVMFPGTPPNNGDFRLGITFLQAGASGGSVLGTQGANLAATRLAKYTGASGTLDGSLTLQSTNERILDYTTLGGLPLLATLDTGTSDVRLYDLTDPLSPVFLTLANNTTGAVAANGNFAGDVRFGAVAGDSVVLYGMNTNNGIQAFTVTIPEPSSALLCGLAGGVLTLRRRRKPVETL